MPSFMRIEITTPEADWIVESDRGQVRLIASARDAEWPFETRLTPEIAHRLGLALLHQSRSATIPPPPTFVDDLKRG